MSDLGIYCVKPGRWFNIEMSSYRYGKSNCGYKTIVRSPFLHNGVSYTGRTISWHCIWALRAIPIGQINHLFTFHVQLYRRVERSPYIKGISHMRLLKVMCYSEFVFVLVVPIPKGLILLETINACLSVICMYTAFAWRCIVIHISLIDIDG